MQVGAITPQNLDPLLQNILECLASTDWATRKAAAEALTALALYSSDLVEDGATSTLTALEASRFDKVALCNIGIQNRFCIIIFVCLIVMLHPHIVGIKAFALLL